MPDPPAPAKLDILACRAGRGVLLAALLVVVGPSSSSASHARRTVVLALLGIYFLRGALEGAVKGIAEGEKGAYSS